MKKWKGIKVMATELVYMVANPQNSGIEEQYLNLIVAIFEQALTDCRMVIYGSSNWKHKDMTLKDKENDLNVIFKELERYGFLEYLTEQPEAYVSLAKNEIMTEFRTYADNNKDETYSKLLFANNELL